jgi:glutamate formiminotransferase
MLAAFEAVKVEASKRGVLVLESELIGLVPLAALTQLGAQALSLPALGPDQIVEMKLLEE